MWSLGEGKINIAMYEENWVPGEMIENVYSFEVFFTTHHARA